MGSNPSYSKFLSMLSYNDDNQQTSSTPAFFFQHKPVVVVVVDYPTPSEGWGHGGRPWSPTSRATLQGLDQRS